METRSFKIISATYGFLGAGTFWLLTHSGPVIAQVNGSLPSFLKLQATSPGNQQTGNSNISGTAIAGQFVGGGNGLTNVNASLLNGLGASAFGKLNSGNTWTNFNIFQDSANIFNGNGNGLTSLSASNVSVGTLSDARLSSNVALLTGSQQFTGSKIFTGGFVTDAFQLTVGGTSGYVLKSNSFGVGTWQPDGLMMPESNSLSGTSTGLALTHNGTGDLSVFTINNGASAGEAVQGDSNGTGNVFQGINSGTGRAGYFQTTNANNSESTVFVTNNGNGDALEAISTKFGPAGVRGEGFSLGGSFTATGDTLGNGIRAVQGRASATSGGTYGGHFVSASSSGTGVFGQGSALGSGDTPFGVLGLANTGTQGYAVYASGDFAATGVKSFRIDHPFDPENKYLIHFASESPFPQNFYNGNVTTDAQGFAWVSLPNYFAAINTNCKYQLTVLDDSADFVFAKVTKEVANNRFQLRTSKPFVKVSWQVTADRDDARIRYNRPTDERIKPIAERGKLQHPEYYGRPASDAWPAR